VSRQTITCPNFFSKCTNRSWVFEMNIFRIRHQYSEKNRSKCIHVYPYIFAEVKIFPNKFTGWYANPFPTRPFQASSSQLKGSCNHFVITLSLPLLVGASKPSIRSVII
jgi:hypothetical protein